MAKKHIVLEGVSERPRGKGIGGLPSQWNERQQLRAVRASNLLNMGPMGAHGDPLLELRSYEFCGDNFISKLLIVIDAYEVVTNLGVSAIGPGDKQLLFSLGAWVITAPRKKR